MNDAEAPPSSAHATPSAVDLARLPGGADVEWQESIAAALEHVQHLLPDQAPIRVFIHHNTLHAFQHLPFHQAVRAGQRVYGAEPYLSEASYREMLVRGRITPEDIEAALRDQFPEPVPPVLVPGVLDELAIRRLMLRHQFQRESDATLLWLTAERGLTQRLPADVSADARKSLLSRTQLSLRGALDLPAPEGPLRFARVVTGARAAGEAARVLADEFSLRLDARELRAALEADGEPFCVRALFRACVELCESYPRESARSAAPHLRLHRELLHESGGPDIHDFVLPELIRLCAAYLDEGLAPWPMPQRELGFYRAARRLLARGSPPVSRLTRAVRADFRRQLACQAEPLQVVREALRELGVTPRQAGPYIEQLLLTMPGWSGMFSRLERKPEDRLAGAPPASLLELLAVRVTYERAALLQTVKPLGITPRALWETRNESAPPASRMGQLHAPYQLFQLACLAGLSLSQLEAMGQPGAHAAVAAIEGFDESMRRQLFQEAFEHHHRIQILNALAAHRSHSPGVPPSRTDFQLICCFDEREESFRRHVEEAHPNCATFGAPGFFGAAMRFRALDQPLHVVLAPVVINPVHHIEERPVPSDMQLHLRRAVRLRGRSRLQRQLFTGSRSLWRGLLLNAAFGSLAALPLLLRILSPRVAGRIRRFADDLLLPSPRTELTVHRDDRSDDPRPRGFAVDERVTRVATVLENIGLVRDFAPVIVVLGHGSTTLNNPHKSAYDCGACGGRQGGPNARVFAAMANAPRVRAELKKRGIDIPEDTFFVGGQHDTCNEDVTLFDVESLDDTQRVRLQSVIEALDRARAGNAQERCRRLFAAPLAPEPDEALRHVQARSEHLAQPRPEFGHATNAVAVVGRRSLTRGLFLDRRAFLISYDPTIDPSGAFLERTLAGATPVGAGINLEYYFSKVDNERYGAGSKLPHNVTGLLGVMSGHASDLRTGLPRQMIEIHEALRLLIVVEATPARLLEIAGRQPEVRELVVNRWVQLVALDPESGAMQVFTDRGFEPFTPGSAPLAQHATSFAAFRGQREFIPPSRIVGAGPSTT
jgi:uncharacterized protein YbcC (UPF0753/DUF2309 family)